MNKKEGLRLFTQRSNKNNKKIAIVATFSTLSALTSLTNADFCLTLGGEVQHVDLPFRAGYHYLCLDQRCEPAVLVNNVWERDYQAVIADKLYTIKAQIDHTDGECNMIAQVKPGECVVSSCLPPDEIAPSIPVNLSGEDGNGIEMQLSWDAATDDRIVSLYKVFRDGELVASTPKTRYTDTELTPETSYNYAVQACDAAGNCSEPATSTLATGIFIPDTTPPTSPDYIFGGLSIDRDGQLIALLSWDRSRDEHGDVVAYEVLRNDGVSKILTFDFGEWPRYTDTGLDPESDYQYHIRAQDDSGNWSDYTSTRVMNTSNPSAI